MRLEELKISCLLALVLTFAFACHYFCLHSAARRIYKEEILALWEDQNKLADIGNDSAEKLEMSTTSTEEEAIKANMLMNFPVVLMIEIFRHLSIEELIDLDAGICDKALRTVFLDAMRAIGSSYWSQDVTEIRKTRTLQYCISRDLFRNYLSMSTLPVYVNLCPERREKNIAYAASANLYSIVRWLSRMGEDVDSTDRCGRTALQTACLAGDKKSLKMTTLLLSLGANVNKISKNTSWSPLMLCSIGQESKLIAKALLDHPDIDMSFKDAAGRSALSYAVEFAKKHICFYILERMIRDNQEQKVQEMLQDMVYQVEHLEQAQPVLTPDPLTVMGETPVESPDRSYVESPTRSAPLLSPRARSDILAVEDKGGLGSVHFAAKSGDLPMTRMLLSSMPDDDNCRQGCADMVDMVDKRGRTPLMIACMYGHLSIARLLASRSTEINVTDKRGKSALSLAVEQGHINIATSLAVDYGADTLTVRSR